MATKEKGSKR